MVDDDENRTVKSCLTTIFSEDVNVPDNDFGLSGCANIDEEFKIIKKAYFKNVLKSHPDKGGDPSVFRDVQASFEVLRDLFDNSKIESFYSGFEKSTKDNFTEVWNDYNESTTPSWEYFASASEEPVPGYRVEKAKSNRGTCKQKGKSKKCVGEEEVKIDKGELRCGWLDSRSGAYSGWVHLRCWRVPSRIWLGIPDLETCDDHEILAALVRMNEVTFCGLGDLNTDEKAAVLSHIKNKENWAKKTKPRKPKIKESDTQIIVADSVNSNNVVAESISSDDIVPHSTTIAKTQERFVAPVPGIDGALADAMKGKTVVLTGIFPECGGGAGLNLGKSKVKRIVEKFGGRCTSAVSGKTDILLVGKEPGMSKVSQARSKPKCKLIGLRDLKSLCMGTDLNDVPPLPSINNFSVGYATKGGANSLEYRSTAEEIAYAKGTAPLRVEETATAHQKKTSSKNSKKKASNKKKAPAKKKTASAKEKAPGKAVDKKKRPSLKKQTTTSISKKPMKTRSRKAAENTDMQC